MFMVPVLCQSNRFVPMIVSYRSHVMTTISVNVPSLYSYGTDQVDVLDQQKTTVSKGHYD